MPQMFSRMDNANWLTPAIADILDQGATPPGGDGSIREQMLILQKSLDELGTPARIVNVRSTPAYTLFIAKPETVGRLGNRRTIQPDEIRRSIGKIAEQHPEWTLGFLPQLQEDSATVGILIRTQQHSALSLRRLLVRSDFRHHPSTLAYVMGSTLEQQLVTADLAQDGHLAVIGQGNAKIHFLRSLLLTIILLNTPAEVRLALAGSDSKAYKAMLNTPHALGRLLESHQDGQRLLDGLLKEVRRRKNWFAEQDVKDIDAYNAILEERGQTPLPRIIMVIDSLSQDDWKAAQIQWQQIIADLLDVGRTTGIYLVLVANSKEDLPEAIEQRIRIELVTRSAGSNLTAQLEHFHGSLLRFVDAFVIDKTREDEKRIIPVELCAVSNEEIYRAIVYWRQAAKQRFQEAQLRKVSGKTGVTDILRDPSAEVETPPAPPVPDKPSPDSLVKATEALSHNGGNQHHPILGSDDVVIEQAIALAAYLGWLGIGPLEDILGLTHEKAQAVLETLQQEGILEQSAHTTLRFVRLKENPYIEKPS
ncbi:MAG: hypothetical protein D6712_06655 [Chloroflexi bacterium]|nr:MAG: hypothetical protein D6712_06655 [Chloroflexota bacterium]